MEFASRVESLEATVAELKAVVLGLQKKEAKLEGDPFQDWCSKWNLCSETVDILEQEGFVNLENLEHLTTDIIKEIKLKLAERIKLVKAVQSLKEVGIKETTADKTGTKSSDKSHATDSGTQIMQQESQIQELISANQVLQCKVDTLQAEVEKSSKNYHSLSSGVTSIHTPPCVAFTANVISNTSKGSVVRYSATLNKGNGLNANTGVFRAQYTGIYWFGFFAITRKSGDLTSVHIRVNGSMKMQAFTETPENNFTLGNAGLINLKAGDVVDVYVSAGQVNCGSVSQFSGFLIHRD